MKILISVAGALPQYEPLVDELRQYADVAYVPLDGYSLKGVDVLIGKSVSFKTLDTADRLKVIFAYKTGVENFPMQELKKCRIILCNSHADSLMIAQYALSLASTLVSQILPRDRDLRKGKWLSEGFSGWKSIYDMKVGLLGFGHIGKEVYRLLKMNGIPVTVLDRGNVRDDVTKVTDIYEMADKTDLIIASLPDTPSTDGLLDKTFFAHMKGKYLVDVGRSTDIVFEDLYEALRDGTLGGAAVDGFSKSPSDRNDIVFPYDREKTPFEMLDNIILSPHCATQKAKGRDNYVKDVNDNVLSYLKGEELRNVVDLDKGY